MLNYYPKLSNTVNMLLSPNLIVCVLQRCGFAGNAPANLSSLREITINILRRNGHPCITIAQRFLFNDIDKLLGLVR